MSLRVDIWSDIACPWCYIGQARFQKALAQFEHADQVDVTWRSFQLDPILPERFSGNELEYLVLTKGMAREQVDEMMGQIASVAEAEGLPIDFASVVPANSLRAHHLCKTVGRFGGDVNKVEHDLFVAHFADGEVISDEEVLVRIGSGCGITADQARAGLDDRTIHVEVEDDFATANDMGINGVPFFVFGEKYSISGAQPPELFAQALAHTWAEQHATTPSFTARDTKTQRENRGPDDRD